MRLYLYDKEEGAATLNCVMFPSFTCGSWSALASVRDFDLIDVGPL